MNTSPVNPSETPSETLPEIMPFLPPRWMRPAMIQTALASQKIRKRGTSPMEQAATEIILNCGPDGEIDNVRLLGSYSHNPDNRALVIFLHGWEGSQDSTYVVSSARQVYAQGASVFRLNYRDHGPSHHLNENIFLATRFDEVREGVTQAAELADRAPVYVVGFSLGGNFALRLARSEKSAPIGLEHIFAISPVIDPWAAAPMVDSNILIQRYFKKKLITTTLKKEQLFPERHNFAQMRTRKTIMEMSQDILPKYSGYPDLASYFTAYRIWPDDLLDCAVTTSLIMAQDDPVVPAAHIYDLNLGPNVRDIRLNYGGHNGFFQSLLGPTWYDSYVMKVMFG